jgi:hypothetical protein
MSDLAQADNDQWTDDGTPELTIAPTGAFSV